MNQGKEIWKDIKGLEGYYQVSNKGRVRSMARKMYCMFCRCERVIKGMVLKRRIHPTGYDRHDLGKTKKKKIYRVHRLVAEAFIRNPDPKRKVQVNHKDCNKLNNHVSNLEWVTPSENRLHAERVCKRLRQQKKS
eukprot:TRINITY_DN88816_c0_g1_i1.p1 TRINITY_DN88816_c0_g1~~TRINITY_DN88816_c0_g1_i1.p1  ORF type:complete len:135 (-),score=1.66 TRINITY_DN88816_c0_g1_i1:75-479(-)